MSEPDAESDRRLVLRVSSRRDEAAFRDLYRRHTPALFALAMRLASDRPSAEDAVHDAWVRAVDGLERFQWHSSLRSWLCGILLNRLREMSRADARFVSLRDDEPIDEIVELPHGIDPIDLDRAIAMLPPGYRQVLVLHDFEGFTHDEIAGLLGIDAGTSKSQLTRGRRRIRTLLDNGEHSP